MVRVGIMDGLIVTDGVKVDEWMGIVAFWGSDLLTPGDGPEGDGMLNSLLAPDLTNDCLSSAGEASWA